MNSVGKADIPLGVLLPAHDGRAAWIFAPVGDRLLAYLVRAIAAGCVEMTLASRSARSASSFRPSRV
jgi:hypothetical protein